MESKNRIDVHTHCEPDFYQEYLRSIGVEGLRDNQFPKWTAEDHLDLMEKNGITKSILSLSMPGVHFGDNIKAREMARRVNEYTANLKAKYPDKFGFFATLTLPDLEGSITEMNYAFDHLKADGVALMTNVGNKYVGDVANNLLFEELNKRNAIVFLHPNNLPEGAEAPGIPPYVADFLLNSVRAAISLIQSGTISKYTNLKVILSHAGGFLPYIATRLSSIGGSPEGMAKVEQDLKRFYFDIAISSSPTVFPSLLAFTDSKHVLFGTDWPFAPATFVNMQTGFFDKYPGLSPEQKQDINYKSVAAFNIQ